VTVSTLVLCGVDDQPRTLRELRRVLRPGGQLLFIEHLRCADPALARLQDRMNWLNRLVVCCDCNRPTLDSVARGTRAVEGCPLNWYTPGSRSACSRQKLAQTRPGARGALLFYSCVPVSGATPAGIVVN
jgi:SAM-dependent methyltransferase